MRTAAPDADFALEAHASLRLEMRLASPPRWSSCIRCGLMSLVRFPIWKRFARSPKRRWFRWASDAPSPIRERFRIFCAKALSICFAPICSLTVSPEFAGLPRWPRPTTWTLRRGMKAVRSPHAAALHAAASMPNFFIAQSPHGDVGAVLSDGFFALPTGPGLGIAVDEKTFERNRIA